MSKDKQNNDKPRISNRVRRDFRYGLNSIVLIAAVLVVFVVLNLALESASTHLTVDLTSEKLYSIGDVTETQMEALSEDVEIIALYDRTRGEADTSRVSVIKVLDLYDRFDRVSVSYVDPEANPGVIVQNVGTSNASSYVEGDYIVKCGDRTRRIAEDDMFIKETYLYGGYFPLEYDSGLQVEKRVTTAILYVTSEEVPVVYHTTGYGERSQEEFLFVYEYLEGIGCEVRELDLTTVSTVPEDAAVLIFMNPMYDLSDTTYDMVYQWMVYGGGQMILCLDPNSAGVEYTNFDKLLRERFGIGLNNDIVSDEDRKYSSAQTSIDFQGYSVSNGPLANSAVYQTGIFSSRSLEILSIDTTQSYIEHYPLIQTYNTAVSNNVLDDTKTLRGIRATTAAGVNSSQIETSRAVVFGSTNALSDAYYQRYGEAARTSQAIFAMSVDWMVESYGENAGSLIDAKTYTTSQISVSGGQGNMLAVVSIVVVPVILIGIGVVVWLRRRFL